MSTPRYLPGTVPATHHATIKQSGLIVWECVHRHPTADDARACAIAEAEVMKSQYFVACPACRDSVEFVTEHYSHVNRDYVCQPRSTHTRKTRSSV